jgi:hypothetical protein
MPSSTSWQQITLGSLIGSPFRGMMITIKVLDMTQDIASCTVRFVIDHISHELTKLWLLAFTVAPLLPKSKAPFQE